LLYRFVGWRCASQGVDKSDEQAVLEEIENSMPQIQWRPKGIFFNAEDCTEALRGEDVGAHASEVAALPKVREALRGIQHRLAKDGCVMDGRDIGTIVLPAAQAKFYLIASQRERARRRCLQLQQMDHEINLDAVLSELKARDERDGSRDCAPLQKADDAIQIDSTTMRADEVVDRILAVLERRGLIKRA
jgi:cytidylate kinase